MESISNSNNSASNSNQVILSNFYGEDLKTVGSNFPMDLYGLALDSLEQKIIDSLRHDTELDKAKLDDILNDYFLAKCYQLDYARGKLSDMSKESIPSSFNYIMKHNQNLGGPILGM